MKAGSVVVVLKVTGRGDIKDRYEMNVEIITWGS